MGAVQDIKPQGGDVRLTINANELGMGDVSLGDSIAVNGVCLTVVAHDDRSFSADVSNESLSLTTIKDLKSGTAVNLEKAMLPTTRLGGHLVSGHVDGLGKLIDVAEDARSIQLTIEAPNELKKYIAVKGSVCIDGVSLTVNSVDDARFQLNIVPHTQRSTIIQHYKVGQDVNIEVDVIARYLERLLLNLPGDKKSEINIDSLRSAGFIG